MTAPNSLSTERSELREIVARIVVPYYYGGFENQEREPLDDHGFGAWKNPPGTPNARAYELTDKILAAVGTFYAAQGSPDRDKLAETIHNARWPADRQLAVTPFADENRNGREYCYRIADAILNAAPANHGTDESRLTLYGADPEIVGDDRESMGSEPAMGIVTGGPDPTSLPTQPGDKGEAVETRRHYLQSIRDRLDQLYALVDDPRTREHLSDEVDWIEAEMERAAPQPASNAYAAMDREQIAKIFAYIWHGDLGEWRGFLSKADAFLAYPLPSTQREGGK